MLVLPMFVCDAVDCRLGDRIAVVITALEDQYATTPSSSNKNHNSKKKNNSSSNNKSDVMHQRKRRIQLSACASDLNAALSLSAFTEGMLVTCCVMSKEDHGYEASIGVKGVRCFLPWKHLGIEDADDEEGSELKLNVGQMVLMQVSACVYLHCSDNMAMHGFSTFRCFSL